MESVNPLRRSDNMVFTQGPSAHLPYLATRAGVGRITLLFENSNRASKTISIVGCILYFGFLGWGFWVWSRPY